jgi:hypothetical protein
MQYLTYGASGKRSIKDLLPGEARGTSYSNNPCKQNPSAASCYTQIVNLDKNARLQSVINTVHFIHFMRRRNRDILQLFNNSSISGGTVFLPAPYLVPSELKY